MHISTSLSIYLYIYFCLYNCVFVCQSVYICCICKYILFLKGQCCKTSHTMTARIMTDWSSFNRLFTCKCKLVLTFILNIWCKPEHYSNKIKAWFFLNHQRKLVWDSLTFPHFPPSGTAGSARKCTATTSTGRPAPSPASWRRAWASPTATTPPPSIASSRGSSKEAL